MPKLWKEDAEIVHAEKLYQEDVFLASGKLIERFRLEPGKAVFSAETPVNSREVVLPFK